MSWPPGSGSAAFGSFKQSGVILAPAWDWYCRRWPSQGVTRGVGLNHPVLDRLTDVLTARAQKIERLVAGG